jgi:hypothetical protein
MNSLILEGVCFEAILSLKSPRSFRGYCPSKAIFFRLSLHDSWIVV